MQKCLLIGYANNEGSDNPAQSRQSLDCSQFYWGETERLNPLYIRNPRTGNLANRKCVDESP